jgi:hypothetical protein
VPDFRLRLRGEHWVYAEVTAADQSESKRQASEAGRELLTEACEALPANVSVQVRFREEPTPEAVASVRYELARVTRAPAIGQEILQNRYAVIHQSEANPVITP